MNRFLCVFVVASLLLTGSHNALSQRISKELRDILTLQDTRSLGEGRLVSYLQDKDKYIRMSAAVALANIQDTSTVSALVPILQDPDARVRASAAFALGQIGSLPAQAALIHALTPDQDMQVLARLFEALGKCGNRQALEAVIAYIPSAKNIAVKGDQALSIGRFALRRITSERGIWFCFDLLKDNHSETRSAALYALWRSAPLGVIDVEISNRAYMLVNLMKDENADVRINLATLLGRTKSDEAPRLVKLFQQSENQSSDWRVQVQLARSMGALAHEDASLVASLVSYLGSANDHVAITALTTLATLDSVALSESEVRDQVESKVRQLATSTSKRAELVQGEAIVTLARLFPKDVDEVRNLFLRKGVKNLLRAKYLEAISFVPSPTNMQALLGGLGDDSVRVAMAAWDYLLRALQPSFLDAAGMDSAWKDSLPSLLADRAEHALLRNDFAVTTLVANVLTDSVVASRITAAGLRPGVVTALCHAYEKLNHPDDEEAILSVQKALVRFHDTLAVPYLEKTLTSENRMIAAGSLAALQRITGRKYPNEFVPPPIAPPTEKDWKLLESIRPGQRVVFRTTKGTFAIRLHKDDAPFTVLAFTKLVRDKLYDGLTFHRVVPDFVIQGGDPRGDGWGGPGFTIRSEFSMANFERGSVGMASSGKDTEGCQFFITHVPTPHLDGRYTLFATVSSGMEVVDKIQVGDRILSAEIR